MIEDLLQEIGTHLDISLYKEAIYYLLQLDPTLPRLIEFYMNGRSIGQQSECLLYNHTILRVTSL